MDVLTLGSPVFGLGQGWGYTEAAGKEVLPLFFPLQGLGQVPSAQILRKKGLGVLGGFKNPTPAASHCLGVGRGLSWGVSPQQPLQVCLLLGEGGQARPAAPDSVPCPPASALDLSPWFVRCIFLFRGNL